MRLLSVRRHVPLDRADEYMLAWADLRAVVESLGARAWIFRRHGHEDQFLEFIEWSDDRAAPLDDDAVATAASRLDAYAAPTHPEEWEEAT